MYQLTLQTFLSCLLSTLFLMVSTCDSGGQTKITTPTVATEAIDENRLPTRRALRRSFRNSNTLTLVYPSDTQSETFYQTRIAAMNENERFKRTIKGLKISELTKEQLTNDIIFIIGNVGDNVYLRELQAALPVELTPKSFVFDEKEYTQKDAIFKLFPYNSTVFSPVLSRRFIQPIFF